MNECLACVHVCVPCVPGAQGEKTLDPLELELLL